MKVPRDDAMKDNSYAQTVKRRDLPEGLSPEEREELRELSAGPSPEELKERILTGLAVIALLVIGVALYHVGIDVPRILLWFSLATVAVVVAIWAYLWLQLQWLEWQRLRLYPGALQRLRRRRRARVPFSRTKQSSPTRPLSIQRDADK